MKKKLLFPAALLALFCGTFQIQAQSGGLSGNYLRQQADAGNAEACYRLAVQAKEQYDKSGRLSDLNDYNKYMVRAAIQNYTPAKLEGAAIVLNKNMQIHHAQAISWLTELAGMTPSRTYSLEDIYYAYFLLGKSHNQ